MATKPTNAEAAQLMKTLERMLERRAELDLKIIKLQNQFLVNAKDPQIRRHLGGCGKP